MKAQRTIDVSHLPTYAFSHRPLTWWATLSLLVMEGAMFVVLVISYFFLRTRATSWPPEPMQPPDLFWGTVNTAIILASCIPNFFVMRSAHRLDLRTVRIAMVVTTLFAVAFSIVRIFEFLSLNSRWDQNAYGSIVWLSMAFHTTHVVTDLVDSVVLTVLMFVGPIEGRRFSDVSENALYWYFVVAMWLVLYGVIYISPRVL